MSNSNKHLDGFDKKSRSFALQNKYSSKANKAMENGIEVYSNQTYPVFSSQRRLSKSWNTRDESEINRIKKSVSEILGGVGMEEVPEGHGILAGINSANPFKNPSQYTWETINKLNESVGKPENVQYIFSMDTEWLGGGNSIKSAPIEIGYSVLEVSQGGVNIRKDLENSFFLQLNKSEKKDLDQLLDKIRKSKGKVPALNADEYRTVKDLINLGSKASGDASKVVSSGLKKEMLNGDNVLNFLEEIELGYDALVGNKASLAITKEEAGRRINKSMMDLGGVKLTNDPMFLWHNGLNADLPVLEGKFGKEFNNLLKTGKHIDTLSIINSVISDPMSEFYSDSKSVKGVQTLPSLVDVVTSRMGVQREGQQHHRAGSDATDASYLFKYLWEWDDGRYRKAIQGMKTTDEVYGVGTKLYATGSIKKDTPLDAIVSLNSNKAIESVRNYQQVATYRNALYEVQKEFIKTEGDNKYYGVVLHNIDDDLIHTIAASNKRDLQNIIQSNFMNMDSLAHDKAGEAIRRYTLENRAMREYRNMFAGSGAFSNFTRYTNALDYVNSLDVKKTTYNNKLTNKLTKQLIEEKRLTKSQAEKFAYMFPRLKSEGKVLTDFRQVINSGSLTKDQKSLALNRFKSTMDEIYAPHTVNLNLPEGFYKQGQLLDHKGTLRTVDLRSNSRLSGSIRNIITEGQYTNKNFKFGDARRNAIDLVTRMTNGTDPLLDKEAAQNIIKDISKINPGMQGSLTGIDYISRTIASRTGFKIPQVSVAANQEALTKRAVDASKFAKSEMNDIKQWAGKYFANNGVYIDDKLTTKLDKIDNSIKTRMQKYAKNVDIDRYGPTKIIEEITSLARAYEKRGINIAVELADEGRDQAPGLIMKMFADEYSSGVASTQISHAAEVYIPLVDPTTGLLGKGKHLNVMTPMYYGYERDLKLNSFQQKIFMNLRGNKATDRISDLIKAGYTEDASAAAKKNVNWSLTGLPAGSRYRYSDLVDDYNFSSVTSNEIRQGTLDLNDLIRGVTGFNSSDMKTYSDSTGKTYGVNFEEFLDYLHYSNDELDKIGYKGVFAKDDKRKKAFNDARKVIKELDNLGIKFNLAGTKGERAQIGTVNAIQADPSRLSPMGNYADRGRDYYRSLQNYYEISDSDWLNTLDGDIISRGEYNKSLSEKFGTNGKNKLSRMQSRLVSTSEYEDLRGNLQNSNTLRVGFMTDGDIIDLSNTFDDTGMPIINKITTHDDMMSIRDDLLKSFTARREKLIPLKTHEDVDARIVHYLEEKAKDPDLGELILKTGDSITSLPEGGTLYKDKYNAIIKGIVENKDSGARFLKVDQIVDGKWGSKVQDLYGASKATLGGITSITDGVNPFEEQLGQMFKELDAVIKPSLSKAPATVAMSQVGLLMESIQEIENKYTVGSAEVEKAKQEAFEFIDTIFYNNKRTGEGKAFFEIKKVNDYFTTVLTENPNKDIKLKDIISETGRILDKNYKTHGVGPESNIITKKIMKNGKKVDKQILTGNLPFAIMNVEDSTKIIGRSDTGGVVKNSLRHLEILSNYQKVEGIDLSSVMGIIEERIGENAKKFEGEAPWLAKSLLDAGGKKAFDDSEVGFIRTTGTRGIGNKYADIMNFEDLLEITQIERGIYSPDELKGTIVDDLFDGRAFYMQTPFEIALDEEGKYKVDKILMTPTHFDKGDNGTFLNDMQYRQKDIFDSISSYNQHMIDSEGDGSLIADDIERIERSVRSYYDELGKAVHYSKGYVAENMASVRMDHSAQFRYRGFRPEYGMNDRIKKAIDEGDSIISRADFREMASGMGIKSGTHENYLDELLEIAEKEGIVGKVTREPAKELSSIQAMKIRVMTEEEERLLTKNAGPDSLRGVYWGTLGGQIAHGGDFDGDPVYLEFTQMSNRKVKTVGELMKSKANFQMNKWLDVDLKYREKFTEELMRVENNAEDAATKLAGELFEKNTTLTSKVSVEDFVSKVVETESRLQKQVGKFSNMATVYKRMTETVGSQMGDDVASGKLYNLMNFTMTVVEQGPISSKRIGERIGNALANDPEAAIDKYITAPDRMFASLRDFDKQGFTDSLKDLGYLSLEEDTGKWYLNGVKTEGLRASIYMNGDPNIKVYENEILGAFDEIAEVIPDVKSYLKGGAANLGVSKPSNAKEAIRRTLDIFDVTSGGTANNYVFNRMMSEIYDARETVEKHQTILEQDTTERIINEKFTQKSSSKRMFTSFEETNISTAADTVKAARSVVGDAFSNIGPGLGIGAAVVGGFALASSFLADPTVDREVEQGKEDQAPSSDGTYVNPAIYAGAPPGAAPPVARLSPIGSGYEQMKININASSMSGLTNEDVAQLVSQEIQKQSGMNMNINITSQDDRTSIDREWLQQQFSQVLNSGYSY